MIPTLINMVAAFTSVGVVSFTVIFVKTSEEVAYVPFFF